MSAATNLQLVSEDDDLAALRREAKNLRDALADSERQKEFIENTLRNVTHHIVKRHEQFSERQSQMQKQLNDLQLPASLVPEIGQVADRCAQALTVLTERVDGLAARETL